MKKTIITVAFTLIVILVNTSAFAEPLNKTLNYIYENEDILTSVESMDHPMIISSKEANMLMKKQVFIASKNSLETLFSNFKDMIRCKLEVQESLNAYIEREIGNISKDIEEKEAYLSDYMKQVSLYINKWDGKDRIISLDFNEEDSILFLENVI